MLHEILARRLAEQCNAQARVTCGKRYPFAEIFKAMAMAMAVAMARMVLLVYLL